MSATYTVKAARNAGEKSNPHGGTLVKWYVTLADEQGAETSDVYCQKKPENPLNPGDTIYGRLEQGEYGWRLYPEQNPNGSQGRSGGGKGGVRELPPEFWAAKDRRIGRAGMLQAVVSSGVVPSSNFTPRGEELATYVRGVNEVTDALIASLDERTPPPNEGADLGGGGETSMPEGHLTTSEGTKLAGPTAADVSAKGFTSTKQRDYFESLLRQAGAKPETVDAITLYASEALSGRQGGAISEAIDGLREESTRRHVGKTLALAAEEWRNKQPVAGEPDATDLPPADGMAVGAADDDIPF